MPMNEAVLSQLVDALDAHFAGQRSDSLEGAHKKLPNGHPFSKLLQRKPIEGWEGRPSSSMPERDSEETTALSLKHQRHRAPNGTLISFPSLELRRVPKYWDDDVSTGGPIHTIPLRNEEAAELHKHFGGLYGYDKQQ